MVNFKLNTSVLYKVWVPKGAAMKLSGVIDIIPQEDTTLIVKVPVIFKGNSQISDLIKSVEKAGGTVDIIKK